MWFGSREQQKFLIFVSSSRLTKNKKCINRFLMKLPNRQYKRPKHKLNYVLNLKLSRLELIHLVVVCESSLQYIFSLRDTYITCGTSQAQCNWPDMNSILLILRRLMVANMVVSPSPVDQMFTCLSIDKPILIYPIRLLGAVNKISWPGLSMPGLGLRLWRKIVKVWDKIRNGKSGFKVRFMLPTVRNRGVECRTRAVYLAILPRSTVVVLYNLFI